MDILHLSPRSKSPDEVLHRFAAKSLKTPFSVELVYLPFVLFRFRIERTTFSRARTAEEGLFLADLVQGSPMNILKGTAFELEDEAKRELDRFHDLMASPLRPKRTVTIGKSDIPEDRIIAAAIRAETAIDTAKKVYRYDLMRVTGGLRFRRMEITVLPPVKTLYYPFWLVYYRDKKSKMRFDVYDGLLNRRERGEIVRSIKLGLIKEKRGNLKISVQGREGG